MGGDLLETLSVARLYCPGCEPNVDPVKEILDVRWCTAHRPKADGVDDAKISAYAYRSEEHTSELQSRSDLVCRLLLEKKKKNRTSQLINNNMIVITHYYIQPGATISTYIM